MTDIMDSSGAPPPFPPPSLIKFGPPICISTDERREVKNREDLLLKAGAAEAEPPCGRKTLAVLDEVLPPRYWSQSDHSLWWQRCDTAIPTREDVFRVEERLDGQLKARNACPKPLCSIREELFPQVFDELIRQVVTLPQCTCIRN